MFGVFVGWSSDRAELDEIQGVVNNIPKTLKPAEIFDGLQVRPCFRGGGPLGWGTASCCVDTVCTKDVYTHRGWRVLDAGYQHLGSIRASWRVTSRSLHADLGAQVYQCCP